MAQRIKSVLIFAPALWTIVVTLTLAAPQVAAAEVEQQDRSVLDSSKRHQLQTPKVESTKASPRIVHFPQDRPLGSIYLQDDTVPLTTLAKPDFDYRYLGPATGDVTVPPGKRLLLFVTQDNWKDLSPLSTLGPDDLYRLNIIGPPPGGLKPDDRCVKYLGCLTGLSVLELSGTDITSQGLQHIRGLKSLHYLTVSSPKLGDKDLALLADFDLLETLCLAWPVTDEGLRNLPALPSLKELSVWVKNIRGPGLAHLAKLPKLEYLWLGAAREDRPIFTDSGLKCLKDIPSLRKLSLSRDLQITDAGMAHLANLTRLEELDIADLPITDTGLAHLQSLSSLRKLDFGHRGSRVTEKGLIYLKQMKFLESLTFPSTGLSDAGMAQVSEFDKLKLLQVGGNISDTGLGHLAKLGNLEVLSISESKNTTDTGISHVAKLTNLKELALNCPNMTNEGLARLSTLKSLVKLYFVGSNATLSGLSHLNGLGHLNTVSVYGIKRDDGVLDIGGLTALERVIIQLDNSVSFRDEDLACFAKLKHLTSLQIAHRGISNAGLKQIEGLTSLERLSLGGAGLTDDGLSYLANMNKLGSLTLTGKFTDNGLLYLERLPALVDLELKGSGGFSRGAVQRFRRSMLRLDRFVGYESDYTIRPSPSPEGRRR